MAYIPSKNTSVSGTVGASVIGLPYFGVAGSVATVPVSNQSVSGTVNVGGSVVAFQSDPTKLLTHASVSGNVNVGGSVASWPFGNQSVSGTMGASIIGLPYFGVAGSVATVGLAVANQSVSGTVEAIMIGGSITTVGGTTGNSSVQVVNFPTNQNVVSSVVSVIPGTGNLNLGKLTGSVAGNDDVGVAALGKLEFDDMHTDDNDNEYDNLHLTSWHEIKTRDQRMIDISNCNNASIFATLGDDTVNLTDTSDHVFGRGAIVFDKVDGTDNTLFAGVDDSFTAKDITNQFESGAFVGVGCKLPTVAGVDYVFNRLGTDNANYNEWTWPASTLTAGQWMALRSPTNQPASYAGAGWVTSAVGYNAFGVAFTSIGATATGIKFDNIHLVAGRVTDSTTDATISTNINTPNINIQRVGGVATATNIGNANAATLRVVNAADATVRTVGSVQLLAGSASIRTLGVGGTSSVQLLGTPSISGNVTVSGTPSISGAVTVVLSSIAALQGTNPWIIGNSSVQLTNSEKVIGSVAALQGTNPWVVSGNSSVQLTPGQAAIGSVAVLQGTSPWTVGPSSVMLIGSTNSSISTLVTNQLQGVSSVMLFGSTNSSVRTVQAFGYGSVMLMTSTDASIRSLVYNQLAGVGSVMLFGSTNTSISTLVTNQLQGVSSVMLFGSTNASVMTNNPAIYAANSGWVQNKSIMATGGLRNDTLASITAADSTYSPFAVGPSGETIVANAPITKWISATTSVMSGPSVLVFSAPGSSIFNYVSGVQVTNPGTVAAHVTFTEGLGAVASSMLFFAMAPAGGGSNMVFPNPIKTTLANKNISASVSAHSSVYIMMEGFTVKQLT